MKKKVVIVGAGFGGLAAAKTIIHASNKNIELTVIDEKNHHLFQPLLYQVATAGLSPAEIAAPIRSVLKAGEEHVNVIMDRVLTIDHVAQKIILKSHGQEVFYDYLLLACGASHSYFGNDEWENYAPGLKTLEQATEIRRRILEAFEKAETSTDPDARRDYLSFVVVGGGPTGVELAGAIGEISRQTLAKDFANIDPSITRIILIEAGNRILASFSEDLSRRAMRDLEKLGVTVWTSMKVTKINEEGVQAGTDFVKAKTVIWAAGVQASSLGASLKTPRDRQGRVEVDECLRIKGFHNIYAIGDMAHFEDKRYGVLPGLAPVAIQQGVAAGKNILAVINGGKAKPYRYFDKGQMATIGRSKAVAEFKGIKMTGLIAWFAWLLIHIYYLIGFRSKLFVMFQWISSYVFFKRGARLITSSNWKKE